MPIHATPLKWKPVILDEEIFSKGIAGIEGLVGIEELHDYNIESFKGGKKPSKNKKEASVTTSESNSTPNKKKAETQKPTSLPDGESKKGKKQKSRKKSQQKTTSRGWSVSDISEEHKGGEKHDNTMSAWRDLFVPAPVLEALSEIGFHQPTQIQTLALPPAIMGKRDILGAAETGSGKTLAFGIPIIHGILQAREKDDKVVEEESSNSDDKVEDVESEEEEEELQSEDGLGCVKVVPLGRAVKPASHSQLYALILTPTRELAIQVKNHLVAAAKHCNIKVATVVGGMSQEKQERVLRRGPEIVVATPGRLWELIKEGNPHLQQVDSLKFLVIDEADRMLERGHFQELQELLERLELQGAGRERPQTLVFSATLTLVHEPPNRLKHKTRKNKKKTMRVTPGQKLQELINILGMQRPKIVDVTAKQCTAEKLTEAHISCGLTEKDAHLYCFLQRHPGRTLVFCNSVTCVRRLIQLFTLLQCRPYGLHAHMAQRQRLKSLDRFAADPRGLLLATDVAARGLDIPNVQHVIHYQVPRTSESYVHRSGRTARAHCEGLTLLLVEPKEMPLYMRLCRTLGRDDELPQFPVDAAMFGAVQARVQAARQLEALEHTQRRVSAEEGWVSKAALEMDLHFDEHDRLPIKGRVDHETSRNIAMRKKNLMSLLKTPLTLPRVSNKYPTVSGSLKIPFAGGSAEDAVSLVKSAKPGEKRGLGTSLGLGPTKKRRIKHKKKKKSVSAST